MPSISGLSFDCLLQPCLRTRLRRRASRAFCIDNRALHRVEIGSPHLFTIRTLLSKVGFEPVTSCSGGKDVSESGPDLLWVSAPSALVALYPFPCHLFPVSYTHLR